MPDVILPASNWTPRPYQQAAWDAVAAGKKRLALCWHRRAGKDDFALHHTACSMFERVGNYWHMLPQANQARRAIWEAVNPHTGRRRIDEAFPEELRETTRDQEMFIRFKNGSTWTVFGSDNYESGIGSPPVGVVFSEYALADPQAWAFLRPILAENGGWAMFISTPRGRNHFSRLVEYAIQNPDEWHGEILTVADTNAIPPEVIDRERRELAAERGDKEADAIVAQEYYCDFDAALPGAYYGEHMTVAMRESRIGDLAWIPGLPVGVATDLGHGDQCVNWLYQQLPSGRVRVIDVLVGSGVGVDWYAKRLLAMPYQIVDTIWPHDGGHGNIRDVNGTSLVAMANKLGWKPIRLLERDPIVDMGIQAVRQAFPLLEFNTRPIPHLKSDGEFETPREAEVRMARALDALRQYRREWDEKRQRFKDHPLHDWTSDYADALRYLVRGRRPFPGQMGALGGVGDTRPRMAIMD
jgi:hypothetical protein